MKILPLVLLHDNGRVCNNLSLKRFNYFKCLKYHVNPFLNSFATQIKHFSITRQTKFCIAVGWSPPSFNRLLCESKFFQDTNNQPTISNRRQNVTLKFVCKRDTTPTWVSLCYAAKSMWAFDYSNAPLIVRNTIDSFMLLQNAFNFVWKQTKKKNPQSSITNEKTWWVGRLLEM